MNESYKNITNIRSLREVLEYIKALNDPSNIFVWFDWDDTIINPRTHKLLEPKVTKELFDYLHQNQIYYGIITARFYQTVCDPAERNILDIRHNILDTIFPTLKYLGASVDSIMTRDSQAYYEINNGKGECVGIIYMGIIFSSLKGQAIKSYHNFHQVNKQHILFIDDYEPFLMETTSSFPQIKAFRRYH